MITNAYSTDIAILVVDAQEGVMPQTREHLLIMQHFGVQDFIVFINKKNNEVDSETTVELVEMDVRELFGAKLDKVRNDCYRLESRESDHLLKSQ